MRLSRTLLLLVLSLLLLAPSAGFAQFGHPLKGQWSGQWGPPDKPRRLLLDLHWDGKAFSGQINPGDEAAKVTSVTFDYSNPTAWKVKLQAEGKDPASGKPISISVDGTLENIGAYNKLLHGTWTENGQKGDFTVTRN